MSTMSDIYQQQADQLAYWLAKGKTLKQASAIVARRKRKGKRGPSHSPMGVILASLSREQRGEK